MKQSAVSSVRVWDLPTRLFHWALATTVIGSLISAQIGGSLMQWHFWFGYSAFALLAFRLLWGLFGGRWSRFASFIYAPGTVLRYLRGQSRADEHVDVGHNPLGSFSVFALLLMLSGQVATGLVADDEIATVGPLNRLVSSDLASSATSWHASYGQWLVFGLIALHGGTSPTTCWRRSAIWCGRWSAATRSCRQAQQSRGRSSGAVGEGGGRRRSTQALERQRLQPQALTALPRPRR